MKLRDVATVLLACVLVTKLASAQAGGYAVAGSSAGSSLPDELLFVPSSEEAAVVIGDLAVDEIFGLSFREDGVLFGVSADTDSLIVLNTESAAVSTIGPLGIDLSGPGGLTFDKDGELWLASGQTLYRVDPASGEASNEGTFDDSLEITSLTSCGDRILAGFKLGFRMGIAELDPAAVSLSILSEMDGGSSGSGSWVEWDSLEGIGWSGSSMFMIATAFNDFGTPPPLSNGSFFFWLSPELQPQSGRWFSYGETRAFAAALPQDNCEVAAVAVPALTLGPLLGLTLVLAVSGVTLLYSRKA